MTLPPLYSFLQLARIVEIEPKKLQDGQPRYLKISKIGANCWGQLM